MQTIGIIPMAARPFHAGHDGLISIASAECDFVEIYAANTSSRGCVSADAMHIVWERCILPRAPWCVYVHFTNNPVTSVYERLMRAVHGDEQFWIYGDPIDVSSNFPDRTLSKHASTLLRDGRVSRRPVERSSTVDVSGTLMREWLQRGDEAQFCEHLPKWIDKEAVWSTLRSIVPT